MVSDLQRLSAILFFATGITALAAFTVLKRMGAESALVPFAHSLDLPLLTAGMLYGGTSLYQSLTAEGEWSPAKALLIALPLCLLFAVFAYLNFALPFAE